MFQRKCHYGRASSCLMIALLVALVPLAAGAQEDDGAQGDYYAWTAPSADEQLAADDTPIPAGQGALFAPALSKGVDEPEVVVFAGDERVASGRTGRRIVVAPGSYTVRVGSGVVNQMMAFPATVEAGATTSIPPGWAGLKVEVVDTQNIPLRSTYEIIRAEDREVLGIGYGADLLQAEPLATWLLKPGLYRIVRSGETFRARKDFATVLLPEGGLAHFKLVLDSETGDFRGAGVVTPGELGVKTAGAESNWVHVATVSGAATLSRTNDFVGRPNQSTLAGTVFVDYYSTYENGPHFFTGLIEMEEGFLQVDPEQGRKLPTQQIQDRLRGEALYIRYQSERWGPYARLGLLTNVFDAETLATDPLDVAYNKLDGTREVLSLAANEQYRTADAFGSLRLREGFGVNVRLFRNQKTTVNWRGGLGLRQNMFSNTFVENDSPLTPELDLFQIDDFSQEGLETILTASVRLTRLLSYITDLEVFADFDDTGNPTIDWSNTLSLRLNRYLSLDYTYDLLDFPQVSDKTQTRQNLLLRASFDLL
ncbi:MAG: hypothetical protein OES32_12595 [Acidobacteriota bacterium]|nr:hypothetical protein [Acidobacteriota bacterium]